MTHKIVKKYMSDLAKRSHKKSPRDPGQYKEMQKRSVAARLAKKLSTPQPLRTASKGV